MGVRSGYPLPAHAHPAYDYYKTGFHCSHPLLQRGERLSPRRGEVNGENAADCAKGGSFFAFVAPALFGLARRKMCLQNQKCSYIVVVTCDDDKAAIALAALGHAARLSVFRLLVKAGPDGLMVGEIGAHLDMPLSTLAHHLRALKQAGLISQVREGREVLTRAETTALHGVVDYLLSECCQGVHPRVESA